MEKQIRLSLTVDAGAKRLIEDAAAKHAEGNISAYVRGLALLHALIETRRTGKADIPGWLLNEFPLDLIEQLRIAIASYKSQDIIDGELQTDQVVEVPAPKHRKK
ncbi:MAG TPA: hypothetical protein VJY15_23115 [Candidatus Acidoferrum sp.]|nr:hypothetical protein [Candidatus Acidoferrum sp.]